jgi:hypothetical protein
MHPDHSAHTEYVFPRFYKMPDQFHGYAMKLMFVRCTPGFRRFCLRQKQRERRFHVLLEDNPGFPVTEVDQTYVTQKNVT